VSNQFSPEEHTAILDAIQRSKETTSECVRKALLFVAKGEKSYVQRGVDSWMQRGEAMNASSSWDFGFFVKGIPPDWLLLSDNLRMAKIPANVKKIFDDFFTGLPAMTDFWNVGDTEIVFVFVRVSEENESEAIAAAWRFLSHVIDGYALVLLENTPKVAPILLLRKGKEQDVEIHEFLEKAWMTLGPQDPKIANDWMTRCHQVLDRLLPFYEKVLENKWEDHSPLENQILYSLRLFRRGCRIESYGVEFLCKFAAMEGLVCDGKHEKAKKLKKRIPQLMRFAAWDVKSTVNELWEKRHLIAHAGRAEFFPRDDNAVMYEQYIPRLEQIAEAVFVFAIDNISNAKTVTELWKLIGSYQVPDCVKQERHKDLIRLLARNINYPIVGHIKKLGTLFDQVFKT
jgi:hypothetical protein